jgi:serine/threonine-protein kinase
MVRRLRRRARSLRESGLTLRGALAARSAGRALAEPPAPGAPTARQLGKLAAPDVLGMPHGTAIRRAAEDRAAILAIVAGLPKADRALLPEVGPAVDALVERVAHLAQALHRLDESIDPRQVAELGARIAAAEREGASPDGERRLALFRRQRATLDELAERRAALLHQLESAGLALGNLRLDLVKFRSAGGQAALTDVSTATQEARVLSREIADMLAAAAEVRSL